MEFTEDEVVVPSTAWWKPIHAYAMTWLRWQRLTLMGVTFLCLAGNIFVPSMLNALRPPSVSLALFLVGGLTMQVVLLATYAALATTTSWATSLGSVFLLLVAWGCYWAGLNLISPGPREAFIFLLVLCVISFLWYAGFLAVLRRIMGCRILHMDQQGGEPSSRRVSIADIMLVIAFAALANWCIKWALPVPKASWPLGMMSVFIFCCFVLCLECMFLAFYSMVMLLNPGNWIAALLAHGIIIPMAAACYMFAFYLVFRESLFDYAWFVLAFLTGHVAFTCAAFALLRVMGYRLFWGDANPQREQRAAPGSPSAN